MIQNNPTPASDYAPSQLPWSRGAERAAVIAFWTFLAAMELVRQVVDPFRMRAFFGTVAYVGVASYFVWAALTPLIFALARRFPLETRVGIRRLGILLLAGIAIAVSVELLKFISIRVIMERAAAAQGETPRGFFGPSAVFLRLWFLDEFVIYLAVLAAGFARNFFIRLRAREREAALFQAEASSLQAQLSEARLSALRMQLNPHFLFNTLHSVSSMADDDPEGVQRVVAKLSGLLRRALDGAAHQEVTLAEELAFSRDYFEIQQVRFQGRLAVREEVDQSLLDALVPNLILQPLVENAVRHAGDYRENGKTIITISASRDAARDLVLLTVSDNGPGLAPGSVEAAADAGRVGIANTRARLEALYGETARLELGPSTTGGVSATIAVPYHTAADVRKGKAIS